MTLVTISKKNKVIATIVAIILAATGYYLAIYKSFAYQSSNETYGTTMVVIAIAAIQMMWLNIKGETATKQKIHIFILVPMAIIIIIAVMMLKATNLNAELDQNGENTVAKVIGFETEGRRNREYVVIQYRYNNTVIVQRFENYDKKYLVNQQINIKFSKNNPEIFMTTDK